MENNNKSGIMLPFRSEIVLQSGQVRLRITFNAANGRIDVHSNQPIYLFVPVGKEEQWVHAPHIGEEVEHGWKYGGLSVTTGFPLFVAPRDEPLRKVWNAAMEDAAAVRDFMGYHGSRQRRERDLLRVRGNDPHDHGVRLPTAKELDQNLFAWRSAIGGFDQTGPGKENLCWWQSQAALYWSSTPENRSNSYFQRFSDGLRDCSGNTNLNLIRLVRS